MPATATCARPSIPTSWSRARRLIALDDEGEGEPLVLVHGSGTSRAIWRRSIPQLARRRRVLAPDVPGYGASPPAGPGFELEEVADRLADGLEEAGADAPFDLVGHSMGGALAVTLAHRRPDTVRRLVLVAPAGLAPWPRPLAVGLGLAARPFVAVRRALGSPLAVNPLARRVLLAGAVHDGRRVAPREARAVLESSRGATRIAEGLASAAAADLRPELAELPMPLGLVWGERDLVVLPSSIDVVRAVRPEVPVARVADAGHAPMLERPDEFCRALDEVLDRLSVPVTD